MNDMSLEMHNADAISRLEDMSLTPPDPDDCKLCAGTGYVLGTATEQLFGDKCPNRCPHNPAEEDLGTIRRQGQG